MEKQEMKVIMVGSLADGMGIHSIVPADEALDVLASLIIADGKFADGIELSDPFEIDKRAKGVAEDGTNFVVYGKGLGNGFSVYGPFEDYDDAERFAEQNRDEDEEWEIFCLSESEPESETVEHFTEIMQHRIKFWLRDVDDMKAPEELDETSIEHITKLISEGYNQGELCILGDDGDTEFRGWWNIERNCDC